jgi:hypothetical protein
MRLFFSFVLMIVYATNSFATYTDTIDVWTVRLNGKPIIHSNQMEIIYDHPMMVNLSSFADTDTLEVCYWTDHSSERQKWHYILRDTSYAFRERFTNPIDTTIPGMNFEWRRNYISFRVDYLKKLCKEKNVKRIFVQFEFDNMTEQNSYFGKSICIISKD